MKHTKDSIIKLLETNDNAVDRAVYAIYRFQTADEARSEETKYSNGVGFSGAHGHIGTSMGKQFEKRGYLTTKQRAYWQRKMASGRIRITMYAGQLAKIANKELESV